MDNTTQSVEVRGQHANHKDADGKPVIAVNLVSVEGSGMDSFFLYRSVADAAKFPIGSRFTVTLVPKE